MTAPSTQLAAGKILIIDDQEIELQLCKITFQNISTELSLLTFNSGESALEYLRTTGKNEKIRLMLLDLKMPKMDGLGVLETIQHEQLKQYPIVIFTTSRLQNDRHKALELGADDFLEKPVDLNDNMTLFRKLLRTYGDDRP